MEPHDTPLTTPWTRARVRHLRVSGDGVRVDVAGEVEWACGGGQGGGCGGHEGEGAVAVATAEVVVQAVAAGEHVGHAAAAGGHVGQAVMLRSGRHGGGGAAAPGPGCGRAARSR